MLCTCNIYDFKKNLLWLPSVGESQLKAVLYYDIKLETLNSIYRPNFIVIRFVLLYFLYIYPPKLEIYDGKGVGSHIAKNV